MEIDNMKWQMEKNYAAKYLTILRTDNIACHITILVVIATVSGRKT